MPIPPLKQSSVERALKAILPELDSIKAGPHDAARGKPVAYIADDDDSTIYLWSGKPVAYLHKNNIYGFNAKHLGWFVKGAVYNHDGEVVGAIKSRLTVLPQVSLIKSIKQMMPIKSIKEIAPVKPIFQLTWSKDDSLRSVLRAGAD